MLEADLQIPVLGVCLGMQALAVAYGATVCHAPEPIHGRLSHIEHTGHNLFHNIPFGEKPRNAAVLSLVKTTALSLFRTVCSCQLQHAPSAVANEQ